MNIFKAAYLELRCISSIHKHLSVDANKTCVSSLVLSRLNYCNLILSGSSQYILHKLQKVQNTAAWIILIVPWSEHILLLLCTLHWLSIQSRIKHKMCSLYYVSLTDFSPTYLSGLTHVYIRTRYFTMKTKSYGQCSLAYLGPATWNELHIEIRHKDKVIPFKSALKTHLYWQEVQT
jgi:hypothetical protein